MRFTSKMYEQHQKNNLKYVLDIVGVKESDYISVVLSADQQEYVLTLTNGAEFKIPSGLPEHDN